jgi:hypothetical protein
VENLEIAVPPLDKTNNEQQSIAQLLEANVEKVTKNPENMPPLESENAKVEVDPTETATD